MKKCALLATLTIIAPVVLAAGGKFMIRDGVTDWTSPQSYTNNAVPGAGDFVLIPANATVRLSDAAADADSVALANALMRIIPVNTNSVLEIDVADTLTLTVPVTAAQSEDLEIVSSLDYRCGPVVKKGAGVLTFAPSSAGRDDIALYYPLYTSFQVKAGDLIIYPEKFASKSLYLGYIQVAGGSTVYLPESSVSDWNISLRSLDGAGNVVFPTLEKSHRLVFAGEKIKGDAGVFSGVLSGSCELTISGDAQTFIGSNTYTGGERLTASGARLTVSKMGADREASPVGTYNLLTIYDKGGCITYCNEMPVSDGKGLTVYGATAGGAPAYLDGGSYGDIAFAGAITKYYNSALGQAFVLTGDNVRTNVLAGALNDSGTSTAAARGYPMYLCKEGAGVWRMAPTATVPNPLFASGVSVSEGRLQFTSIDEAGIPTALGVATNLTDGTIGPDAIAAAHRVDYAFKLGAPRADGQVRTTGRLEYAGTTSAECTTRPAALAGTGGFRNDTAKAFRFAHVTGISDQDMTLVLDGTGTANNEIGYVSDGTAGGKVSVLKDGPGKWILSGDQTFTGDLTVKGGTLVIRKPADDRYTYFRFNVRKVSGTVELHLEELGLFDATGARCNTNLTEAGFVLDQRPSPGSTAEYNCDEWSNLEPGQAAIQTRGTVNFKWGCHLDNLFDAVLTSGSEGLSVNYKPLYTSAYDGLATAYATFSPTDTNTWMRIIMRLADGSPVVTGYDHMNIRASNDSTASRLLCFLKDYSIEGSTDGFVWDELASESDAPVPATRRVWAHTGTKNLTSNPNAPAISGRSGRTIRVMDDVRSVSVSDGATLKLEGGGMVALKGLKVDAKASSGSIVGFSLAEEGTLTVENVEKNQSEIELPIDLSQATDVENASAWTLFVNGKNATDRGWTVRSAHGKLTIVRPGMMILFR